MYSICTIHIKCVNSCKSFGLRYTYLMHTHCMYYSQQFQTHVQINPIIEIESVIIIRLDGVIPVALELVGKFSISTIWNQNGNVYLVYSIIVIVIWESIKWKTPNILHANNCIRADIHVFVHTVLSVLVIYM